MSLVTATAAAQQQNESALGGLRTKQLFQGRFRVFDDQPFLFWPPLALGGLRPGFFSHSVLSSHWFLSGCVAPPGIGPGRPEWARDCKSRLSASSSTGPSVKPNAGTGGRRKRAVPALFRPFSAAPDLFSWRSSSDKTLISTAMLRRSGWAHLLRHLHQLPLILPSYLRHSVGVNQLFVMLDNPERDAVSRSEVRKMPRRDGEWIQDARRKMESKGTVGKFGKATPKKIAAAKKKGGLAEKRAVFAENMKTIAAKRRRKSTRKR